MGDKGELSELELLILRSMARGAGIEGLAKAAKVPAVTLGKELAVLQLRGYVSDDGSLTEKGLEAIGP